MAASKTNTTIDATSEAATPPPADVVAPKASPLTNAYSFNQAVSWLSKVAQQAQSLTALQTFLVDVAADANALVYAIDQAEQKTLGRIAAGVPTVSDAPSAGTP